MTVVDSLRIANAAWNEGAFHVGVGILLGVVVLLVVITLAFDEGRNTRR